MSAPVCNVCGEQTAAGVQFCTSCGAFLGWTESGAGATPPGAPPAGSTAPAAPTLTPMAPRAGTPLAAPPAAPTAPPAAPSGTASSTTALSPPTSVATSRLETATGPLTGPACSQCGTRNDPSRRFCRTCGHFVGRPTHSGDALPVAAARLPWWRRLLPRRTTQEKRARRAYRRSLPVWVRLRRWLVAAVVVVLVGVYLTFVGHNPVGWAKQQWYALRGTVTAAKGITAGTDPPSADPRSVLAAKAVDGDVATSWQVNFAGGPTATGTACARTVGEPALVLSSPKPITVRGLRLVTGVSDPAQRLLAPRPATLDLEYSDGSCRSITVKDDAAAQQVSVPAQTTTVVRITVAAAYPAQGGSTSTAVAISEVSLLVRPSS
jgi:hypothetical protein